MRKNIELRKAWSDEIRYCDGYSIEIFMMYCDDVLTLNVSLNLNGEGMYDNECVMSIEDTDIPTNEMKKKFKSLVTYFSKHFENVKGIEEVMMI